MPPAFESFEGRTFKFGCAIVRLYLDISKSPRVPPYLARQILASGTSIGANIEESRACQSRRDTAAKFSIALKEARETLYWLRLLAANDLLASETASPLMREANELISILTVTRRRLATPLDAGTPRTERPRDG